VGSPGIVLEANTATQGGLFALLPQVVDGVRVPVAAGGVGKAHGVVAASALGASGVQLGTVYLACPEANVSPLLPPSSRATRGQRDGPGKSIQWPPRKRYCEPISSGSRSDVRYSPGIRVCGNACCTFAQGFGKIRR